MQSTCIVVLPFNCFEPKEDEEGNLIEFRPPSCWYILNAMGEYVFIKKRLRQEAQTIVDTEYGKGRYTVRAAYNKSTSKKTYTVKGR